MVTQIDRGTAQIHLEVDGQPAAAALARDLISATIESAARLPDSVVLRFHDLALLHSTEETFKLGQKLRVELGDSEARKEVFIGEVTSIELDLVTRDVTTLVVTAYDKAHRLHRGRSNRVFNDVTDSDIASQIARIHGLHTDLEATQTVHAHVLQNGQTDWEFLSQRAASLGYELLVYDDTLYFKQPPARPSDDVELVWQGDLESLVARMSTFEQVNSVEVRAWNALDKEVVSGVAEQPTLATNVGDNQPGGKVAQQAFRREASLTLLSEIAKTDLEAQRIAQAVLDDVSNTFLNVEGDAVGNPTLRAGSGVVLKAVGPQFTGRYIATAVRHQYDSQGHHVHFKATGNRPSSILSELIERGGAQTGSELMLLQGLVTDNQDPDDTGRVKVKFPQLGDDVESAWCRIVAPGAGKQRGIQFMPEIDDEVLTIGTIGHMYVLGGMWNKMDPPPLGNSQALDRRATRRRIIKSREGHFIQIDDDTREGGIVITSADQLTQVAIKAGGREVEITADKIKLHARSELTLESDGRAKLSAKGTTDVESAAQLTLKGVQINAGR